MTDPARIEQLEIKLAHLERALQQLSDELARQQQDIARLLIRNQQLARQLASVEESASSAVAVEIPPHY